MIFVRWGVSFALAVGITGGLFYFMQFLIATGERIQETLSVVRIVDATMPEIDLEVVEEIDRPEMIEEVDDQEVDVPDKQISLDSGPSIAIARGDVDLGDGLDLTPATINSTDGDYLPLVAIAPQYPTRAAQRGIEGWCLVSFTVDGLGNVVEDSIVVVDAEPPNIFDRSSVRAAARFKFQPRVVDGVGVEVRGVQYVFRYELED
ncbi:MAG: energy transducer TonB [Gammaproteobacteria bacterium]|nr:energy transducer TonB [Gammaproteobacteria bacterium]MCY4181369.1 energy transducer TonB [Gammaproteobacteria bacterium]MCY4270850.1 energy transducer TonB [Gammaproteobacteria bacterium]MCY4297212.1 energy transducer TonB [Gammaproteobacteria bacterium]